MDVDSDGESYRWILGAIGGDGFDQLALAELDRDNVHARSDGARAAVWTRNAEIRAKLTEIATDVDDNGYGRTHLMDALAAHSADAGLRSMVENGSPVYLRAVDIRDGGPDWARGDVGEIRDALKSAVPDERCRGIALCGFLGTEQAGALLAPVFEDPRGTDEDIAFARGVLAHLGYYEASFLPRLAPMLVHDERGISTARYLALAGDEAARAAVVN